jgi:hypothetical protein
MLSKLMWLVADIYKSIKNKKIKNLKFEGFM